MSNCVHSTDFLPQRAAKSKCQWKMRRTDGKGCVCRQMREWLWGQMRVKNIKIRHFGEVDFQKKISRYASNKWDVTRQTFCQVPIRGVWVGDSVHLEFKSSGFSCRRMSG